MHAILDVSQKSFQPKQIVVPMKGRNDDYAQAYTLGVPVELIMIVDNRTPPDVAQAKWLTIDRDFEANIGKRDNRQQTKTAGRKMSSLLIFDDQVWDCCSE